MSIKKPSSIRKNDPHFERERKTYEQPLPSREYILQILEEQGMPISFEHLCKLLDVRKDDFVRQFNKKLLGFALGRGVRLSDEPLLDEMQQALAKNDYRVSAAVETIVLSPQFREIRGRAVALEE